VGEGYVATTAKRPLTRFLAELETTLSHKGRGKEKAPPLPARLTSAKHSIPGIVLAKQVLSARCCRNQDKERS